MDCFYTLPSSHFLSTEASFSSLSALFSLPSSLSNSQLQNLQKKLRPSILHHFLLHSFKAFMAASHISNPDTNLDSSRKKRQKLEDDGNSAATTQLRWRSDNEQRIYSTKLVEALRKVRQGSSSSSPAAFFGGKTVKEAADRVLAVVAKGTTRWSRAILTSRLRMSKKLQKSRKLWVTGKSRRKRTDVRSERRIPAVQKKVKVLSRLVPGCRRAPLPNLLEETTDYIAALEMQVRAMTVLTEFLSGAPPVNPI